MVDASAKWIPDLEVKYIPSAGHWVQQQEPEKVKQYMREFLGKKWLTNEFRTNFEAAILELNGYKLKMAYFYPYAKLFRLWLYVLSVNNLLLKQYILFAPLLTLIQCYFTLNFWPKNNIQIRMHKGLILFILNDKCRVRNYRLNLFICEYAIKSYPTVCVFIA